MEGFRRPTTLLEDDGRSFLVGEGSVVNGYHAFSMKPAGQAKNNRDRIKSIQSEIFWSAFDIKNSVMRRDLFDLFLKDIGGRDSEGLREWRLLLESRIEFLSAGIDLRDINSHFLNTWLEKGLPEMRYFGPEGDVLSKALFKNAKSFDDAVNMNILSFQRADFERLRAFFSQVVLARTDTASNPVFSRLHGLASSDGEFRGRMLAELWEKVKAVEAEGEAASVSARDFVDSVKHSLKREVFRVHHEPRSPSSDKTKAAISNAMERDESLSKFVYSHRQIAKTRYREEEALLDRELTPSQWEAIERAHRVGDGEEGLVKGSEAGIGNYTGRQLAQKVKILRDAGFNKEERELLVKSGIVGTPKKVVVVKERQRIVTGGDAHWSVDWAGINAVKKEIMAKLGIDLNKIGDDKALYDEAVFSRVVDVMIGSKSMNFGGMNVFPLLKYGHSKPIIKLIEEGVNPRLTLGTGKMKGMTLLHGAAMSGSDELVEYLLEKGLFRADVRGPHGWTPLHAAAYNNNREVARILLEAGANVNAKSKKTDGGSMALHMVAENGSRETLELLLEWGADITAKTKDGRSVFKVVAERGNEELVEFVLDRGKEGISKEELSMALQSVVRNKGNAGIVDLLLKSGARPDSALHVAVGLGDIDMVRLLLERGADVNFSIEGGVTALHGAVSGGQRELAEFLVENGADVNRVADDGGVPLQMAFDNGYRELFVYLLQKGADINVPGRDGRRPLHKAAEKGDVDSIIFFVGQGADVNLPAKDGKMTLDFAIENQADHESIGFILERVLDLDHAANDGMRAMDRAIERGEPELVRMLIAAGADPHIVNGKGRNAFQHALDVQNWDVVRLFLESGFDPDKNTTGLTMLQETVAKGSHKGVEALLSGGADPDVVRNGLSALHLAIKNGHVDMVRSLVAGGANLGLETAEGLTPLWLGVRSGNNSVVKTLLKKGVDGAVRRPDGSSVLHQAVDDQNDGMLGILLRAGIDPDMADEDGMTALHKAVESGRTRAIRLLLEYGADHLASNKVGLTPLDLAAERPEILGLFAEKM